MKKKITKANLIAEIAETTTLNKKQVASVLNTLTQISYREATNGFIVPGICKLTVVRRKERRCRIPSTGQLVLIGERDALKITPIGAAKNAVAPKHMRSITVIDESHKNNTPAASPPKAEHQNHNNDDINSAPNTTHKEDAASAPNSGSIVFGCHECGSMISAPTSSAGQNAGCPFCGIEVTIPLKEDPTTSQETTSNTNSGEPIQSEGFMTFFCGECGQEIESSKSMAGLKASCPTCGSQIDIPNSSMPPSIDVSDNQDETSQSTNESPSMTMRIDRSYCNPIFHHDIMLGVKT